MRIDTSRFGSIDIEPDDILLFPIGLIGLEHCRHWILLSDADNEYVGWLQSISAPDIALAVVSPRCYVPNYKVRIVKGDLISLQLTDTDNTFVLVVVGKEEETLTINLRAPILINLDRRLGKQVVTKDDQPLKHIIAALPGTLRRSA